MFEKIFEPLYIYIYIYIYIKIKTTNPYENPYFTFLHMYILIHH